MTWRERARAHGWRVDEPCECEEPDLAIVGGDGFVAVPLLCLRCRGRDPDYREEKRL